MMTATAAQFYLPTHWWQTIANMGATLMLFINKAYLLTWKNRNRVPVASSEAWSPDKQTGTVVWDAKEAVLISCWLKWNMHHSSCNYTSVVSFDNAANLNSRLLQLVPNSVCLGCGSIVATKNSKTIQHLQ